MDKSRRGIRNLYITSKNHPGLLGQFHRKSKNAVGVLHRPSQSLYYQEKTPIESTTVPDHVPYFLGLKYFKDNVAVSNTNSQFTYADLFNRYVKSFLNVGFFLQITIIWKFLAQIFPEQMFLKFRFFDNFFIKCWKLFKKQIIQLALLIVMVTFSFSNSEILHEMFWIFKQAICLQR